MILYPAIDIKDGRCVRLKQGLASEVTVYSSDPAMVAARFINDGAPYLHVVDLDGAFSGEGKNAYAIKAILNQAGNIPVQLGGGIRTLKDIEDRLSWGVTRVILGSAAVNNQELVKTAAKLYQDRIIAGIDAKNGFVTVNGWVEATNVDAVQLGNQLASIGIKSCIFTDVACDGMLGGVSLKATENMVNNSGLNVIASGGVSCNDDLIKCKNIGCAGVIIGKALYNGNINLQGALKFIK